MLLNKLLSTIILAFMLYYFFIWSEKYAKDLANILKTATHSLHQWAPKGIKPLCCILLYLDPSKINILASTRIWDAFYTKVPKGKAHPRHVE